MAGIPKTFFGRKVYDGHAFLNILKAEKEIEVSSNMYYSKASRYTASRSADLGDTRFLIGSQNTWDALSPLPKAEQNYVHMYICTY